MKYTDIWYQLGISIYIYIVFIWSIGTFLSLSLSLSRSLHIYASIYIYGRCISWTSCVTKHKSYHMHYSDTILIQSGAYDSPCFCAHGDHVFCFFRNSDFCEMTLAVLFLHQKKKSACSPKTSCCEPEDLMYMAPQNHPKTARGCDLRRIEVGSTMFVPMPYFTSRNHIHT